MVEPMSSVQPVLTNGVALPVSPSDRWNMKTSIEDHSNSSGEENVQPNGRRNVETPLAHSKVESPPPVHEASANLWTGSWPVESGEEVALVRSVERLPPADVKEKATTHEETSDVFSVNMTFLPFEPSMSVERLPPADVKEKATMHEETSDEEAASPSRDTRPLLQPAVIGAGADHSSVSPTAEVRPLLQPVMNGVHSKGNVEACAVDAQPLPLQALSGVSDATKPKKKRASRSSKPSSGDNKLRRGSKVSIQNLVAASEHNEKTGTLCDFDAAVERWEVHLPDGTGIKVKAENLVALPADQSAAVVDESLRQILRSTMEQQTRVVQEALVEANDQSAKIIRQRMKEYCDEQLKAMPKAGVSATAPTKWTRISSHPEEFYPDEDQDCEYLPLQIRDIRVLQLLPNADGYLVDNSSLQSPLAGLTCRNSKDIEDSGERIIEFGSLVDGIVEQSEDGVKWLKVSKVLDPHKINEAFLPRSSQNRRGCQSNSSQAYAKGDCNGNGNGIGFGYAKSRGSVDSTPAREEDNRLGSDAKQRLEEDRLNNIGVKNEGMKNGVFADAAAMKNKVKEAINRTPYRVEDFYWKEGIAQEIARSSLFDNITLAVIAVNAVWIWIDTDYNKADVLLNAEPHFIVMENLFCTYFTFEWMTRYLSFQKKWNCIKDPWFVFDSTLVSFMVVETWCMTLLILILYGSSGSSGLSNASMLRLFRLLRLTRMARMVRLLRAMPELMILVKAIVVAFRSVFFTLCLLTTIIYVFSICFVQLTVGSCVGQKYFSTVPTGMLNLLLLGNLPDFASFAFTVSGAPEGNLTECEIDGAPIWGVLLMMFIFLAPLTVLGMLAGVLVEVVSVVSNVEKETMVVTFVTQQLRMMLNEVDLDQNGMISQGEFSDLVVRQDAARMMASVGVDVIGLADFCDFLFSDCEFISFSSFMELVLQLRGTNQATVKDIVDMRKFVRQELVDHTMKLVKEQEDMLVTFVDDLDRSRSETQVQDPPVAINRRRQQRAAKAGTSRIFGSIA